MIICICTQTHTYILERKRKIKIPLEFYSLRRNIGHAMKKMHSLELTRRQVLSLTICNYMYFHLIEEARLSTRPLSPLLSTAEPLHRVINVSVCVRLTYKGRQCVFWFCSGMNPQTAVASCVWPSQSKAQEYYRGWLITADCQVCCQKQQKNRRGIPVSLLCWSNSIFCIALNQDSTYFV